jgi:hypothetical protein
MDLDHDLVRLAARLEAFQLQIEVVETIGFLLEA